MKIGQKLYNEAFLELEAEVIKETDTEITMMITDHETKEVYPFTIEKSKLNKYWSEYKMKGW